jgi:hypothetical protein
MTARNPLRHIARLGARAGASTPASTSNRPSDLVRVRHETAGTREFDLEQSASMVSPVRATDAGQ